MSGPPASSIEHSPAGPLPHPDATAADAGGRERAGTEPGGAGGSSADAAPSVALTAAEAVQLPLAHHLERPEKCSSRPRRSCGTYSICRRSMRRRCSRSAPYALSMYAPTEHGHDDRGSNASSGCERVMLPESRRSATSRPCQRSHFATVPFDELEISRNALLSGVRAARSETVRYVTLTARSSRPAAPCAAGSAGSRRDAPALSSQQAPPPAGAGAVALAPPARSAAVRLGAAARIMEPRAGCEIPYTSAMPPLAPAPRQPAGAAGASPASPPRTSCQYDQFPACRPASVSSSTAGAARGVHTAAPAAAPAAAAAPGGGGGSGEAPIRLTERTSYR